MQPAEDDVTGKVVFMMGAGRDIGKGIAQVLAEAGADVAINVLTPRYVESTAAERAAQVVPSGRPGRLREVGCWRDTSLPRHQII